MYTVLSLVKQIYL